MDSLRGRTVLITGATGSGGRAAAAAAAGAGMRLVLVGRDAGRLDDVAARLGAAVTARHLADAADPDAVGQLATAPWASDVDAVWHLVGGWRGGTPLPDQPLDDWDWLHAQLVRTTVNLARTFAEQLAARPAGRFAIVSSPLAARPTSTNAAYAVAKAAAEATVLALAHHFRGSPATANVVVVPSIGTTSPTAVPPDDVAAALLYLTSDAAAKMNGQRLSLHAGGPS